jgi:hypothetical protein
VLVLSPLPKCRLSRVLSQKLPLQSPLLKLPLLLKAQPQKPLRLKLPLSPPLTLLQQLLLLRQLNNSVLSRTDNIQGVPSKALP